MKELFHNDDTERTADNPEEFIEVFEEVNKIFARQTMSRLTVPEISAQPLVSTSSASPLGLAAPLTLYLIATFLVPYFL